MDNPERGLVIVGGGTGAHTCVQAYRDAGGTSPVTIVSDDDRAPYFRPALTKELITGEQGWDDLPLEDDAWWDEHDATLRLGVTAFGFDAPSRTLATSDGPVPFGSLVLATGSSASSVPVPGADHERVLRIRHAADAARLLDAVDRGGDVLVIGSGFIGCELAASLHSRGVTVTMATMEAAPQAGRLGDEVGAILAGWLAESAVEVHGGVHLQAIEHGDGGSTAVFEEGLRLDAAHVVMATGARPNLDVATAGGLDTEHGVPVDASMRTALDGVLAIGDIAHALHPVAGRRLRVEHWGDAERMGTVAGHVLAGQVDEWREVPGFWSVIGGRELKYVAWGDGYDDSLVRRSADGGFTVWYAKDDAVCGVLTYLHDEDNEAAAQLITSGAPIPSST